MHRFLASFVHFTYTTYPGPYITSPVKPENPLQISLRLAQAQGWPAVTDVRRDDFTGAISKNARGSRTN